MAVIGKFWGASVLAVASGLAQAGQVTAVMPVSANVVGGCSNLSADPLAFGTVQAAAVSGQTVVASYSLTVSCSVGTQYTLSHDSATLKMDALGYYVSGAGDLGLVLTKPDGSGYAWPHKQFTDPVAREFAHTAASSSEVLTGNAGLSGITQSTNVDPQQLSGSLTFYLDF